MRIAAVGTGRLVLALVAVVFVALAFGRPVDHDESQYVAAAVLTASGRLPYSDYAYLQTPLQPFAFAPIAFLAGVWTWPALRIVNALLGAAAVAAVHRGAREAGASWKPAIAAALLFAGCDILLFSVAVARNDALAVACFAWAVALIAGLRPDNASHGRRSAAIGLLLALAAAAKISYALPAAAYGGWALLRPRRRHPLLVAAGAAPVLIFVAWTAWRAPEGFLFGTLYFPAGAPSQFYADHPWKLSLGAKAVDAVKFLALGAGLPAFVLVVRDMTGRRPGALEIVLLAAIVSALLPSPTWRQYLLPVLPPLFVRLAVRWQDRPPPARQRWLLGIFAAAGLVAAAVATAAPGTLHLLPALRDAAAARRVMDAQGIDGPVVTLAPQMLSATGRLPDVRFATGPFYYRSSGLLAPAAERRMHLVSHRTAAGGLADAQVALIGGENEATSGDRRLDETLARTFGGAPISVPGTDLILLVREPNGAATAGTTRRLEADARAEPHRARAQGRRLPTG